MKLASIIFATALGISSAHAVVYTLSGSMDVLQAGTNGGFGSGSGNGTGSIIGSYDDVTNLLDYTITFSNLSGSVNVLHFHSAPPGSGGGVALGIPGTSSPINQSGVSLTSGQESQLLGGLWYVNVHTTAFTGGEIRGQVAATPVPEPASSALLLGGLGALALRRRRS